MRRRASTGQAIAEGAAALVLIIGGTVLAVLLLVNSGMAAFYKIKLSVVTAKAADYASSLKISDDPEWQQKTKDRVKWLIGAFGIKYDGNPIVTFASPSDPAADPDTVLLTVKANGLTLVGDFFKVMSMEDIGIGTPGPKMNYAGAAIVYRPSMFPPSPTLLKSNPTRYYVPLLSKDSAHPPVLGYLSPTCINSVDYMEKKYGPLP